MSDSEKVVLKSVEPQLVASGLDIMPTDIDPEIAGSILEPLFGRTVQYAISQEAQPSGSLICIYYDLKTRNHINLPVEAIVPIPKKIPENDFIKVYELPKVEKMASIVHRGSFATIAQSYEKLDNWINKNRYQIIGGVREVYINFDQGGENSITELQYPVEKIKDKTTYFLGYYLSLTTRISQLLRMRSNN